MPDDKIINEIINSDLMKRAIRIASKKKPFESRIGKKIRDEIQDIFKKLERKYGSEIYNEVFGAVIDIMAEKLHNITKEK